MRKNVAVIHPDSKARITLRSILESHGWSVATDHSCSELLLRESSLGPDLILMDRALLAKEGFTILSRLSHKWEEVEIVFLPEGLRGEGVKSEATPQLLKIVDRLLRMRTTRELLAT